MAIGLRVGVFAAASSLTISGCSSLDVTGASVAYCEEQPSAAQCATILRKAKEQGIAADPEALARTRQDSRDSDYIGSAENRVHGARRVGRVIDVQTVARGTLGSNAGAALGSAAAQAAYVDHTVLGSGNYSALQQVGVGIMGAAVGSSVDRPAEVWYELHHWIDFGKGAEEVVVSSYSPTHPPNGACVAAHQGRITVTAVEECER